MLTSHTYTLEQTGTAQACEYRGREERYVALSFPHTRGDQEQPTKVLCNFS